MKGYLSALRHLQITQGLSDPFTASMPRLELALKGIKVRQGKKGRKVTRKRPITPSLLRRIKGLWERGVLDLDQIMLWAAMLLCFFGFLRSGEITVPSPREFDPSYHVTLEDVSIDRPLLPTIVVVKLKGSKTDPFRQGVSITVGRTGDDLCPVKAMLAYLAVRKGEPGSPLFMYQDGTPLTRTRLVGRVKEVVGALGLPKGEFAGHSFRAGAATTAAEVGLEDSLIQTLGRWRSSAYLLYIRIPREELGQVSKRLSHAEGPPRRTLLPIANAL